MNYVTLLCFVSSAFSVSLGIFVLIRERRSFTQRVFAAGMVVLSLELLFTGLSSLAASSEEVLKWQKLQITAMAFIPCPWLLFSFSFGRTSYGGLLRKLKYAILLSFLVPLCLVLLFRAFLFRQDPFLDEAFRWVTPLGWSGFALYLVLLLCSVTILMNLERTFRASSGRMRWQIKFMILGLGSLFVVRIYTGGQVLLYRSVTADLGIINAGTLLIACLLMARSLARLQIFDVNFPLSHSVIYNSVTVALVGIYFLVVGVLAQITKYLNLGRWFPVDAFLVFLAFLGVSIILLSDRVRLKIRRFISLHLKKQSYDYRKEWAAYTERTARLTEIKDLCRTVAKMASETFQSLSVTVWLLNPSQEKLIVGGSTALPEDPSERLKSDDQGTAEFIRLMRGYKEPFDLMKTGTSRASELQEEFSNFLEQHKIRYGAPLAAGGELQGAITLGDRVMHEPLLPEEFDLLKTICDQTAASILSLRLSEQLRQAKEMEAFQTMSSFVVHDLKNLASSLSLTVQNLPTYFNNPEFREDALRVISQSVSKIRGICGHLSTVSQRIELKKIETDINKLVISSLSFLNGPSKASIGRDLKILPRVEIDPEQIRKVLNNLILNASEAVSDGGEIKLTTERRESWIVVSVTDNGCGMSKDFIERSLFRPFKTTKKQGMGIGLFQSKMIVEAHRGHMEVESTPGHGSTFRVFLPIGPG